MRHIGRHIKTLREDRGLKQKDLERSAGIPESYLGRIERGEHHPRPETLERIALALGLDGDYFEPDAPSPAPGPDALDEPSETMLAVFRGLPPIQRRTALAFATGLAATEGNIDAACRTAKLAAGVQPSVPPTGSANGCQGPKPCTKPK